MNECDSRGAPIGFESDVGFATSEFDFEIANSHLLFSIAEHETENSPDSVDSLDDSK